MSQVNPGMRLLSCGCLLNTTVQPDGTGRCDFSPCKESCPNVAMVLSMAQSNGSQIFHKYEGDK
jgi:hypothetical protein